MLKRIAHAACVVAAFGFLTGCGGSSTAAGNAAGGSGGNPGGSGGTTTTIEGIATPSSVAVVTANNSN